MSITLNALETALFTALAALKPSDGTLIDAKPFRVVDRWAGEATREDVDEAILGRAPAALLAHEASLPVDRDGGPFIETTAENVEIVERHVFRVYVVVRDTRGDTPTVKGTTGLPGILTCVQAVKEALAGLRVPGLFGGGVVNLVDHRPWLIQRGGGRVDLVRFAASSALPDNTADEVLPGHPMSRLDATLTAPSVDVDGHTITIATSRTTLP